MPLGITIDNKKSPIVHNNACGTPFSSGGNFGTLNPFLGRGIKNPNMISRQFIGEIIILECAYDPDKPLVFYCLEMVKLKRNTIG